MFKFYKTNVLGMYVGTVPTIVLRKNDDIRLSLNHRELDGKPDILAARLRDPNFELRGALGTISNLRLDTIPIILSRNFLH